MGLGILVPSRFLFALLLDLLDGGCAMGDILMFPFSKFIPGTSRKICPIMADLSDLKRAKLAGREVVHLEWVEKDGKRPKWVLLAWCLGCKEPLVWDDDRRDWVGGSRPKFGGSTSGMKPVLVKEHFGRFGYMWYYVRKRIPVVDEKKGDPLERTQYFDSPEKAKMLLSSGDVEWYCEEDVDEEVRKNLIPEAPARAPGVMKNPDGWVGR